MIDDMFINLSLKLKDVDTILQALDDKADKILDLKNSIYTNAKSQIEAVQKEQEKLNETKQKLNKEGKEK